MKLNKLKSSASDDRQSSFDSAIGEDGKFNSHFNFLSTCRLFQQDSMCLVAIILPSNASEQIWLL